MIIGEQWEFEMHSAAKHINDYTVQIMMLIEQKDINKKVERYKLISKWRRLRDELDSITMGFGEYPYNDMLLKEES